MKTCYFPLIGRLGNLLFQYAYARAYCEQQGYELCLHPWLGEKIFQIPPATRPNNPDITMPEEYYQNQGSLIYTRKQVRQWFRIKQELLNTLAPVLENRRQVLLNVRLGEDLIGAGMVSLGIQCYLDAAVKAGYDLPNCEFETDTTPTRMPQFTGNPDASGLGTTWVCLPSFYRLMTAKVLFRANSTFSWWAATLSDAEVYSPVIHGMEGGIPNRYCKTFVEGNWPVMADNPPNTDLFLKEE